MSDSAKVVRIDEFKARRDAQDGAGREPGGAADALREEPRPLTPREVSHRFAMLAFLRQAR